MSTELNRRTLLKQVGAGVVGTVAGSKWALAETGGRKRPAMASQGYTRELRIGGLSDGDWTHEGTKPPYPRSGGSPDPLPPSGLFADTQPRP